MGREGAGREGARREREGGREEEDVSTNADRAPELS